MERRWGEGVQYTPHCEAEHGELQQLCAGFHVHCMRKPGCLESVCLSSTYYDDELQRTGLKGGHVHTLLI